MSFASQLTPPVYNKQGSLGVRSVHPTNRDPTRKCTVCGRTGHDVTSCFKIVGYPEWYGTTPARGRGFFLDEDEVELLVQIAHK